MKNSKNENEKKSASFFICRIASIIILAVMFVFPFSMREMNLLQPELTSETLYPFKAFSGSKLSSLFLRISLGGIYVIPVSAITILILTILTTFFDKKNHKKTVYLLLLISVTVYLISSVASMMTFANTARWFRELPPLVYAAFAVALVFHIVLITYGIIGIKTRN
ncbi:MAG: hypothetical protein MR305_05315, partial [Treponema porcinum]|nr:hypothetical protein [Treponema porcinum]